MAPPARPADRSASAACWHWLCTATFGSAPKEFRCSGSLYCHPVYFIAQPKWRRRSYPADLSALVWNGNKPENVIQPSRERSCTRADHSAISVHRTPNPRNCAVIDEERNCKEQ